MLTAIPDTFFQHVLAEEQQFKLPPNGEYAVGQTFLPSDEKDRARAIRIVESVAASMGHESLIWRTVPTDNSSLGQSAVAVEPCIQQWFVSSTGKISSLDTEQQVCIHPVAAVICFYVCWLHEHMLVSCWSTAVWYVFGIVKGSLT